MSVDDDMYLTPELEGRTDGLCPALLLDEYLKPGGAGSTEMRACYETASHLLNPAVRKVDVSLQMDFLTESVSKYLNRIVDETGETRPLVSLLFTRSGCTWTMDVDSDLAVDYQIETACYARDDGDGGTRYLFETCLFQKGNDAIVSSKSISDNPDLTAIFEQASVEVQKAVVKCEFPDFPEGGKGPGFKDVYKLNAKLKSGTFSTICKGLHRSSGKLVAVKCVRRHELPPLDDAAIYDEVALLASLGDPQHVIRILDFFEEEDTYFMVKELVASVDLLERIGEMDVDYDEFVAREIISNVLKGLSECHAQDVAHRDINAKSLLLVNGDGDPSVKLSGFGFAARYHRPKSLMKQCGTPFFVAPEILLKKPYDQTADMWSVGCVAYLLLCGNLPFIGTTQKELFKKIVAGKLDFEDDAWFEVSDEAKAFIEALVVVDPDVRLDASDALQHKWMGISEAHLRRNVLDGAAERIKLFHENMHPSNTS